MPNYLTNYPSQMVIIFMILMNNSTQNKFSQYFSFQRLQDISNGVNKSLLATKPKIEALPSVQDHLKQCFSELKLITQKFTVYSHIQEIYSTYCCYFYHGK